MKNLTLFLLLLLFSAGVCAQPSNALMAKQCEGTLSNYGYTVDYASGLNYFYKYDSLRRIVPITKPLYKKADHFTANGLAMAKLDKKYGFIDTLGNVAIPFIYDNASAFSNGISIVFYDCKTALIDEKGTLVMLEKDYDKVFAFKEERAIVVNNGLAGFINKQGHEIVPPKYNWIHGFDEGLSSFTDTLSKLDGIIDTTGAIVLKPTYTNIDAFYAGTAKVSNYVEKEHKGQTFYGLLNRQGQEIIPVNYLNLYINQYGINTPAKRESYLVTAYNFKLKKYLRRGWWRFKRRGRYTGPFNHKEVVTEGFVFNNTGKLLATVKKHKIHLLTSRLAYFLYNNNAVLVNTSGIVDTLKGVSYISNAGYLQGDSLIIIKNDDDLEGLATINGRIILPPVYTKIGIGDYVNKYLFASTNDSTRIYNTKTMDYIKTLQGYVQSFVPFEYEYKGETKSMVLLSTYKGKNGLYTEQLEELLPPVYDIISVDDRHIIFEKDGKRGLLNNKLEIAVKPIYNWLHFVYDDTKYNSWQTIGGLYSVSTRHKKNGIIDTLGNLVVDTLYSKVNYTSINNVPYYIVQKDKKWGLLNATGQKVIDIYYQNVRYDGKLILARKKNKYIKFTTDGKQVNNFNYIIKNDQDKYYTVVDKKKLGLIDTTGKLVLPIEYDRINISGQYVYCKKDKKALLLDTTFKIIIGPEYDFISYVTDIKTVIVKQDKKYGIVTTGNKTVLPIEYSQLYYWDNVGVYKTVKKVKKNELYGVCALDGKIIIEASYKSSQIWFHNETIVLEVDGKRYFYNNKGETVTDCYIDKTIGKNY